MRNFCMLKWQCEQSDVLSSYCKPQFSHNFIQTSEIFDIRIHDVSIITIVGESNKVEVK